MGSSGWSVCWWRGGDCRAQTLGGMVAAALGKPGARCWGPGSQASGDSWGRLRTSGSWGVAGVKELARMSAPCVSRGPRW